MIHLNKYDQVGRKKIFKLFEIAIIFEENCRILKSIGVWGEAPKIEDRVGGYYDTPQWVHCEL